MTETEKLPRTHIAIFTGIWEDISTLDFSELNLRFLKLNSPEFLEIIKSVEVRPARVEHFIKEINSENGTADRLQALIPIDFKKPVAESEFWKIRNILLLIFPSDVTIRHIQTFEIFEKKLNLQKQSNYPFNSTGIDNPYDNYLMIYEREIENVNEFIGIFLKRFDKIKYIKSTFNAYLSSYYQNFHPMEFINLCIGLESLVNARTELKYRMQRNVAVLLTSEIEFAKNIYKSIGKVYDLRSAIVHSGKYNEDKVIEYIPYLRNVISRIITEVISHNIGNLDDLNLILTSKGFGDNKTISENYKEYKLSSSVHSNALATLLE